MSPKTFDEEETRQLVSEQLPEQSPKAQPLAEDDDDEEDEVEEVEDLCALLGLPRLAASVTLPKVGSVSESIKPIAIYEVVPSRDQVPVRAEASITSPAIGMKVPGESIEVVDFDGPWVQVYHRADRQKVKGWMAVNMKDIGVAIPKKYKDHDSGELLRPLAGVSPGEDLLLSAAKRDAHVDMRRLIREGEDPNRVDGQGETPLFEAAAAGSLATVGMLLHLKADPSHRSTSGAQAVEFASDKNTRLLLAAAMGRKVDVLELNRAVEALPIGLQREIRTLLKSVREQAEGELGAVIAEDAGADRPMGAFSSMAALVMPQRQPPAQANSGTADAKAAPRRPRGAFSAQAEQAAAAEEEEAEARRLAEPAPEEQHVPEPLSDADILKQAIRNVSLQPPPDLERRSLYEVIHKPLVAVRAEPRFDGPLMGGKRAGEIVEALDVQVGETSTWIMVEHKKSEGYVKGWMALSTAAIGSLLKPVPQAAG